MATLLDIFPDIVKSTKSNFVKDDDRDIANEITKNTYLTGLMLQGQSPADTFVSGLDFKFNIRLDTVGTAHFYRPGVTKENPTIVNTLSQGSTSLRYLRQPMVWNTEGVLANVNATDELGITNQLYNYLNELRGQTLTDLLNKVEDAWFSTPNTADMEDATSAVPLPWSLPALTSECTNTLPLGFTTICGISPATKTAWQNQKATYDTIGAVDGTGDVGDTTTHLFMAMHQVYTACSFDRLPRDSQFANKATMPERILCSHINGMNQFRYCMMSSKGWETYATAGDAQFPHPTFLGIPLTPISAMSTAKCFPTGTSKASYSTEVDTAGAGNAGARYMFQNFRHLKVKWHREMYFKESDPLRDITDPSTYAAYVDTYYQLVPTSRRKQGVVYPSAAMPAVFLK